MTEVNRYKVLFIDYLESNINTKREPKNLYEPIHYILNLGGKRLRPILTLLSCDLFGGDVNKALDASLAIEMFHNFSLIHDDIMDGAPLRRGKETVHQKWSVNAGILSGDAMLVLANQLLENYEGNLYKSLSTLFNKTALEVCEGQQYDFDFETSNNVSVDEYINMIRLKTAVLVATSLKFGAMIAAADKKDQENIYQFGINLGLAFQLQDDYLDVFSEEDFGKQKAGDIKENKKTILYLKALELADKNDKDKLINLYQSKVENDNKVEVVVSIFKKYNIPQLIEKEVKRYTDLAIANIECLQLDDHKKEVLKMLAGQLMARKI